MALNGGSPKLAGGGIKAGVKRADKVRKKSLKVGWYFFIFLGLVVKRERHANEAELDKIINTRILYDL